MRRSRVPTAEKKVRESKTTKIDASDQKVTRKNFSVSMVNTRSAKENKKRGSAEEGRTEPVIEIDVETPDQNFDEVEKKTTESTPMPNAEQQKQKSMEFSPIDTVEDTTGNTPETIKDESQAKRTSFTEKIGMMVRMKSRDIVEEEQKAEKGKRLGLFAREQQRPTEMTIRPNMGQQLVMGQQLTMKQQLLLSWTI